MGGAFRHLYTRRKIDSIAQGANKEQTELVKYDHVCALRLKSKQQHSGEAADVKRASNIKNTTVV